MASWRATTNAILSGTIGWSATSGGSLAGTLTLAPNGTLIVAGGTGNNDMESTVVTNNGTVTWASGAIRGGSGTTIYNYGLWNAQSDQTFNNAYGGASMVFNNYGTFRKSGGTRITSYTLFAGGVLFNQLAGVIDVQNGSNGLNLVLQGGGNFTGGYITTNQLGVTVLYSGNFSLNGTVTGTNTVENAGNLVGTDVINGALNWLAGNWNGAASVTIAPNGTLIVAGGTGNNDMESTVVTNNGTVTWASGAIRGGSGTAIYNYGLWNAQSDQTFNNAYGGASMVFNNYGTFRKSGGDEIASYTLFAGGRFVQPACRGDRRAERHQRIAIGVAGRRQFHRRLHHDQPIRRDCFVQRQFHPERHGDGHQHRWRTPAIWWGPM